MFLHQTWLLSTTETTADNLSTVKTIPKVQINNPINSVKNKMWKQAFIEEITLFSKFSCQLFISHEF
jgi:hypothetical protein